MDDEKLWRIIDALVRMVLIAQREAAIAQTLAVVANPAMPAAIQQEVRKTIGEQYQTMLRQLDEAPHDALLELLRAFQGTIQ